MINKKNNLKKILRPLGFLMLGMLLIIQTSGCENQMGTQRGVVSGRVIDSNGYAVEDAVLTSHRSLFKASTNKSGFFEFTSLDAGSHRLNVEREGYYPASKTIELEYGRIIEGLKLTIEPLPGLITWQIAQRETDRVVILVDTTEEMSVWTGWRERFNARLQTPPGKFDYRHEIVLDNLWPGAEYIFEIKGITKDGRRFQSKEGTFRTVPLGTMPHPPPAPERFRITHGDNGPMLQWDYDLNYPLKGFRVYRGLFNQTSDLIKDENYIFAKQLSFVDESAVPGRMYSYSIKAVDSDGKVSSFSPSINFMTAGVIDQNMVWRKDYSPIELSSDVYIAPNYTLEIEPGVTVKFYEQKYSGAGYLPDKPEFIVKGSLLINGSEDSPVNFISGSSTPTRKDWDGISFLANDLQNPSRLSNTVISGAQRALNVQQSNVTFNDIVVRYSQTGLELSNASSTMISSFLIDDCFNALDIRHTHNTTIEDLYINKAQTAVALNSNHGLTMRRFDIRDAAEFGVRVLDRSDTRLINGVIQSRGIGLLAGGEKAEYQYLTIDANNGVIVESSLQPLIKNCIIVNFINPSTGYGIEDRIETRSYTYNNIYNFSTATFNADQLGGPIINADPRFYGGTYEDFDYRLKPDSPLMTASDRNGQMGAYGSPGVGL